MIPLSDSSYYVTLMAKGDIILDLHDKEKYKQLPPFDLPPAPRSALDTNSPFYFTCNKPT
jgi:hypothetical protein